ncbi:hypothetical protein M758_12G156300 [Ceratodon purpureus]|nr:hypothetical protein M758_12G156300 [Ceratodon purpureus]
MTFATLSFHHNNRGTSPLLVFSRGPFGITFATLTLKHRNRSNSPLLVFVRDLLSIALATLTFHHNNRSTSPLLVFSPSPRSPSNTTTEVNPFCLYSFAIFSA